MNRSASRTAVSMPVFAASVDGGLLPPGDSVTSGSRPPAFIRSASAVYAASLRNVFTLGRLLTVVPRRARFPRIPGVPFQIRRRVPRPLSRQTAAAFRVRFDTDIAKTHNARARAVTHTRVTRAYASDSAAVAIAASEPRFRPASRLCAAQIPHHVHCRVLPGR
jgi:hypothetical protein